MDEEDKPAERGFLRKAFGKSAPFAKAAGKYLWPFKLTQAVALQKMVVPVFLAHYLIQSVTGALFPTAEAYLAKNDVDPAAAASLSDRTIRVRERNFWGTLHALNDLPTLLGSIKSLEMILPAVQAYAIPPGDLSPEDIPTNAFGECLVLLPGQNVTAKKMITTLTGIPGDDIERLPVSDREMHLIVAFHEFRHCHSGNVKESTLQREGDADVYGMWLAAEALHNKDIGEVFLHGRAMARSAHDHDNALYFDARRRGVTEPSYENMVAASEDAFSLLSAYYNAHPQERIKQEPVEFWDALTDLIDGNSGDKGDQYVHNVKAFRKILKEQKAVLSPLAQRRIELYIEAAEYFAPTKVGAAKTKARTPSSTAPQLGS